MGYSLWIDDRQDIERFYSRREGFGFSNDQIMIGDSVFRPLLLEIDGVLKCDFSLEEIDSFTCGCSDFEEARSLLLCYGNSDNINPNIGTLFIVSSKSVIGKYQVVYDSPLLKSCADSILYKRKRGLPEYLDRTAIVLEQVRKIIGYTDNMEAYQSILQSEILHPKARAALRRCVNSRTDRNCTIDDRRNALDDFTKYCLNYKTFRSFIIWEQKYLNYKKEQAAIKRRDTIKEIKEVYEATFKREEARRQALDSSVLESVNAMRDENGNLKFDQIWSLYDFDDIYARSAEKLKSLGILPDDYNTDGDSKNAGTRRKI